jgi:tRNA modification GTPase
MMSHDFSDVIVAQCTPQGSGSIALIRFSGANVFRLVSAFSIVSSGKSLLDLTSHTISHGFVLDSQGEKIDEVLFLVMQGPKTFTGQDTVEISCHNNQLIIETIIATALFFGARLAGPGEFTKRAVLNQKIDITQAEAIQEIITATNTEQLKKALQQKEGSLASYILEIETLLQKILAFSQVSFEFIEEEDIEFSVLILEKLQEVQKKIDHVLLYHNQQTRIKEGIRVALVGSVNAGKSSLFNALLKQNRAIVSDIPGTTRDSIEAHFYKNGISMTLVDTAGIRVTNDVIEQLGISRTYDAADVSDLVMIVLSGEIAFHDQELLMYQSLYKRYKEKCFVLLSKRDLGLENAAIFVDIQPVTFSVFNERSIQIVAHEIEERCKQLLAGSSPFILSTRQFHLLTSIKNSIEQMCKNMVDTKEYELVAADAVAALSILGEMTGKTIQEAAMDAIFRQFCVGK